MVLYIPELNVIILVSLFVYLFNMPFNLVALDFGQIFKSVVFWNVVQIRGRRLFKSYFDLSLKQYDFC